MSLGVELYPSVTPVKQVVSDNIEAQEPTEDRYFVSQDGRLFGVFDGHGGPLCSEFLKRNLPIYIKRELKRRGPKLNTKLEAEALKVSCLQADTDFTSLFAIPEKDNEDMHHENHAGSCGLITLMSSDDSSIIIANIGDSRAVMGAFDPEKEELLAIQITDDHNVNTNDTERKLVRGLSSDPNAIRTLALPESDSKSEEKQEKKSAKIIDEDGEEVVIEEDEEEESPVLRVAGSLTVSRSFGDVYLKKKEFSYEPYRSYVPYITCEPEIIVKELSPNDKFMVMASDGLWEVLSNEEVVGIVASATNNDDACADLIDALLERRAEQCDLTLDQLDQLPIHMRRSVHDDVTIIILFFDE